jgi:hypothetical protein
VITKLSRTLICLFAFMYICIRVVDTVCASAYLGSTYVLNSLNYWRRCSLQQGGTSAPGKSSFNYYCPRFHWSNIHACAPLECCVMLWFSEFQVVQVDSKAGSSPSRPLGTVKVLQHIRLRRCCAGRKAAQWLHMSGEAPKKCTIHARVSLAFCTRWAPESLTYQRNYALLS